MQRTQRAKAGNIYKKRLEEIQMEAPRLKPKSKSKKKPTKGTKNANRDTKRTATNRTSKSSSNGYSDGEPDTSLNEQSDVEYEFDNGDPDKELKESRSTSMSSSSRSTPASRASLRIQKSLMSKFKCPHCKATFAEERYVDFHCKEVHKSIIQEEKQLKKKTVKEARSLYKQLSRRPDSVMGHSETSPHPSSDSEGGHAQGDDTLDLPDPPEFDLNDVTFDDEEHNIEDYYETVYSDDVDMYKCKKCPNFQVASKHVIAAHIQRHISSIPNYRCPYCRFKANNRGSLEVHIYTHTGVKPFCCKVCDVTFKCMDDLLAHCKTCDNQKESGADAETQEYAGEKSPPPKSAPKGKVQPGSPLSQQHKCPYCTQRFMSLMNLETHINIHRLKGLTEEEREEELRTRDACSQGTVGGGEDSLNRSLPPRGKRRNDIPGPLNVKKVREEVGHKDDPYGQAKRSMINEGPPRCKICSKVFLYTTSIEKHMREVHSIKPECPKPTRFSPEMENINDTIGENLMIAAPSSPSPLTPIITSVTSHAGAAEALSIEGGQFPAIKQPTSASNNTVKKSPPSKAIQSAQMKGKAGEPTTNPMKSVFLLYDPANNTVIPIASNLLSFADKEKEESAAAGTPTLGDEGSASRSAIVQSYDGQQLDDSQLADLLVDQEIAAELLRIGKPGTPLFEGADNQDLEHQCSLCQMKIVGYTEIVKHFHTHTSGDNFACHLCSKRFSSKASLGVHFLIHVGITFSCPLCHKKLAKKQSLLEHIRFHRGERRHTCKICGKAFITSSSLNRHVRMHDPDLVSAPSKFICNYCHRGFQEQASFTQHLRAHKVMNMHNAPRKKSNPNSMGMVPISCHYCGTLWGSAIGLSRHLKSVHGQVLAQVPGTATDATSFPHNQKRIATTPVPTLQIQPEVILTEAEPAAVKIIDVIDLSDDEEKNEGNGTDGGTGNIDSEMENGDISGGNKIGTKVNLDGEEVDAIEVMTTEITGEAESLMETELFPDPSLELEELEVTTTVVAGENNATTTEAVISPVLVREVNPSEGGESGVTEDIKTTNLMNE